MDKLSVLLVEDSASFAFEVEMLMEEMGYQFLPVVDNAEAALASIDKYRPDLILMDIDLKGKLTGLDVAHSVKHLLIPIIFTTSFNDKASYERAKDANTFGYLVKPFDKLSLQSTIETVVTNQFTGQKTGNKEENWTGDIVTEEDILIKQNGVLRKVKLKDVLFIQGEGNYSTITATGRRYVVKMSMKKLTDDLSLGFIPIHRNYYVRIDKIDRIDTSNNQVVIGDHKLPLSRKYKSDILAKFKLFK